MSDIAIVTDRACDLSPELRAEHGITVVPIIVRFGDEVLHDDGSLTTDAFWDKVASHHGFPQTSQPSAGMFEAAFAPLVEAGKHVVCPLITGRLSGTLNAAFVAAQRFPGRVTVFDTRTLSIGQALQVLAAAAAVRRGLAVDAVVRLLEGVRERSHLVIVLDTVEFLRRGGRAGTIMPFVDRILKALRVRPLLRVDDGELKLLGAARSATKAVQRLVDEIARLGPLEAVAVGHTRRPAEASSLAAALEAQLGRPPGSTIVAEAGPALAAHAGPGVIAVAAVVAG